MSAVEKALLSRLTAAAPGAAINSGLIKWENYNPTGATFTPPKQGLWYRVYYLPGVPVPAGIGEAAPNRLVGVLQIDVMIAPMGQGTKAVDDEAARIMACFKRGYGFSADDQWVEVMRSYLGARGIEDAYWKQIIKIEFSADIPN